MVHIKYISLNLLLLCLLNVNSEKKYDRPLPEETIVNTSKNLTERLLLNGTLQQTAKKFHCRLDTKQNVTELLLYGTKAWTFPMQDVNLTLRYPSENQQEVPEHVITGVTVILHMDGFDNGGHIKSGGLLEDNILMTFILNSTSRLTYQFWLYGVKKTEMNLITLTHSQDLC